MNLKEATWIELGLREEQSLWSFGKGNVELVTN